MRVHSSGRLPSSTARACRRFEGLRAGADSHGPGQARDEVRLVVEADGTPLSLAPIGPNRNDSPLLTACLDATVQRVPGL